MSAQYDVVVNYLVKGSPTSGLGAMNSRINDTEKAWERLEKSRAKAFAKRTVSQEMFGMAAGKGVGDVIAQGFTGAAAAVSTLADSLAKVTVGIATIAAGGLAGGLIAGIGINQELQDLKISLAATFQANYGIDPFTQALGAADSMMQKLRKDANDLPGTLQDLGGIFKSIAPVSGNLGLTPEKTEALAAHAMAAGKVSGLSGPVIGREMSLLLSGNAHANNVLGVRLGLDMKALNKMSGEDRVKTLTTSLARYDDAIKAFSHSYSGVSTTFADNAKMFLGALTQPAFRKLTSLLEEANGWWTTNRVSALRSANVIGEAFVHKFDMVREKIEGWIPALKRVAEYISNLDLGDVAKHGGEAYLGMKIGSAAMSAAPGLLSMSMVELTATMAALGPVALFASAGLLAVTAAFFAINSGNQTIANESNMAWRTIQLNAKAFFDTQMASMDTMSSNALAVANGPMSLLGVGILELGAGLSSLVTHFSSLQTATEMLLAPFIGMGPAGAVAAALNIDNGVGQGKGRGLKLDAPGLSGGFNEADGNVRVVNHNTTINGGVHLHVEGRQEDPNRIARLVGEKFERAMETPTKSKAAGQWSSSRRNL